MFVGRIAGFVMRTTSLVLSIVELSVADVDENNVYEIVHHRLRYILYDVSKIAHRNIVSLGRRDGKSYVICDEDVMCNSEDLNF